MLSDKWNILIVSEGDDDDSEEEVEKKDDGEKGEMFEDKEVENADETEIQEKDTMRKEKVSTGCWF